VELLNTVPQRPSVLLEFAFSGGGGGGSVCCPVCVEDEPL